MAKAAHVTTWQVREIWKADDLKPHRLKTFKIRDYPGADAPLVHCAYQNATSTQGIHG